MLKYLKMNIGCGLLKMEGYKNIDISPLADADEVYDASLNILETTDTVETIHCGCMMEQIDDNNRFINFLNECNRVLIPGGKLYGYVPSTDSRVLFLDPMDKRFFKEQSFDYFVKGKNEYENFGRVYGFTGWSKAETKTNENGIIHFELIK